MRTLGLALACLAFLAGGCGDDDGDQTAAQQTTAPPADGSAGYRAQVETIVTELNSVRDEAVDASEADFPEVVKSLSDAYGTAADQLEELEPAGQAAAVNTRLVENFRAAATATAEFDKPEELREFIVQDDKTDQLYSEVQALP